MVKNIMFNSFFYGFALILMVLLDQGLTGETQAYSGQFQALERRLPPEPFDLEGSLTGEALVFILSGQSNMHGQSPITREVWDLQPRSHNVEIFCVEPHHFFDASDRWRTDIKSPRWEGLRPCGSNGDLFGPEMSFGFKISQRFPGRPIKLIKFAHGGTSLFCEWQPTQRSAAYLKWDGDYLCPKYLHSIDYKTPSHPWAYRRLIRSIDLALSGLQSVRWSFGGMIWVQGEADADGRDGYDALVQGYQVNLKHFVEMIRSTLHTPELPFVAARIKCGYQSNSQGQNPLKIVRQSIDHLQDELDYFYVAETWDLSMQEDRGDCCHFGSSSMLALGERLARSFPGEWGPIYFPAPSSPDCQAVYGRLPP
jgi:hypothetical protein